MPGVSLSPWLHFQRAAVTSSGSQIEIQASKSWKQDNSSQPIWASVWHHVQWKESRIAPGSQIVSSMLLSQKELGEASAVFQKPDLQLKRRASFISHHLPGASKPEDFQPRCLFHSHWWHHFQGLQTVQLVETPLLQFHVSLLINSKSSLYSLHIKHRRALFSQKVSPLKVENRRHVRKKRLIRKNKIPKYSSNLF